MLVEPTVIVRVDPDAQEFVVLLIRMVWSVLDVPAVTEVMVQLFAHPELPIETSLVPTLFRSKPLVAVVEFVSGKPSLVLPVTSIDGTVTKIFPFAGIVVAVVTAIVCVAD